MTSREPRNDFCTIDILETQTSEMTFSQEVTIIINEFQRMINILVGIEKDLANELPRYVSDIDVCPELEPPKKRRKTTNA
jgi:hypothetical protein